MKKTLILIKRGVIAFFMLIGFQRLRTFIIFLSVVGAAWVLFTINDKYTTSSTVKEIIRRIIFCLVIAGYPLPVFRNWGLGRRIVLVLVGASALYLSIWLLEDVICSGSFWSKGIKFF